MCDLKVIVRTNCATSASFKRMNEFYFGVNAVLGPWKTCSQWFSVTRVFWKYPPLASVDERLGIIISDNLAAKAHYKVGTEIFASSMESNFSQLLWLGSKSGLPAKPRFAIWILESTCDLLTAWFKVCWMKTFCGDLCKFWHAAGTDISCCNRNFRHRNCLKSKESAHNSNYWHLFSISRFSHALGGNMFRRSLRTPKIGRVGWFALWNFLHLNIAFQRRFFFMDEGTDWRKRFVHISPWAGLKTLGPLLTPK